MRDIYKDVLKFRDDRDWKQFHTPENLSKSISIEAAELLECFQWDDNYKKENVCEELADVMIYGIMLADILNVSLDDIILEKLKKNNEKYPVDKAKGTNKKYSDL